MPYSFSKLNRTKLKEGEVCAVVLGACLSRDGGLQGNFEADLIQYPIIIFGQLQNNFHLGFSSLRTVYLGK